MLFSTGDTLTLESLPILPEKNIVPDDEVFASLNVTPEEEKEKIIAALQQTNGNKSKAAVLLRIDRKTLYNKMSKYKLT